MKQYKINGKDRLCYVVTKGKAADIVIPYDNLAPVDNRRISEMESEGGELMRTMRETIIEDNGVNALVMYQNVFVEVKHEVKKEVAVDGVAEPEPVVPVVVKKRRGRPRKNK